MAAEKINLERYARQLALPDIDLADQKRLSETRIMIIGAGGLGAASLPYLAAAGIGHITILDHDTVSISNLHRQTIYKDAQNGQSKAKLAAQYARDLNPDINIIARTEKLTRETNCDDFDLLIDGTDNFETKTLLNEVSVHTHTPLISASVNQWQGQAAIFAGYAKTAPCYHCLFPALPTDARNCNEAGILGTAAGITGLYQAHLTLGYLLGLPDITAGTLLCFDYKTLRMQKLTLPKDPSCPVCKDGNAALTTYKKDKNTMAEMLSYQALKDQEHIIVDVRTTDEVNADPIDGDVIHMELTTVPAKHDQLPKDKLLAFVCAGNVRSVQAAQYLEGLGYTNVCILDKFSL